MDKCPCCGETLPGPAIEGELCPACTSAMQFRDEFSPGALPEREVVPSAPYPVTKVLLLINLTVFMTMTVAKRFWPHLLELQSGTNFGPYSIGGQWWRLLSSTFIHFNAGHLGDNLFGLWLFGKRAERVFGRWIFLSFYLTCGIGASLTSLAVNPEKMSAGASGAIFGVAGGLISTYALRGLTLPTYSRWKLGLLVIWAAVSVYPSPGVDNAAHAGGLLIGLMLGAIISATRQHSPHPTRVFASAGALLLASGFVIHYFNGYVVGLAGVDEAADNGNNDYALQRLEAVLRQKPNSLLANEMAAEAYYKKGSYQQAELAARRAIQRDPADDHARYLLGIVELKTGRCSEAQALAYHELLTRKKYDQTVSLLDEKCNYIAAGELYLVRKQADKAIEAFQEAVRSEPNNVRARLGLAKAYRTKGLIREAEAAERLTRTATEGTVRGRSGP